MAPLLSACLPETTVQELDSARRSPITDSGTDSGEPEPAASPSGTPSGGGGVIQGGLGSVSLETGNATGYARDTARANQSIYVEFYIDGPAGTGTFGGSVLANVNRTLFPSGPYGFSFPIPAQFRDAKLRRLYGYAIDPTTSQRAPLDASPQAFIAGTNQAGIDYFNNSVKPAFQASCTSCHGNMDDYYTYKLKIMIPSRFDGGSATNNSLFNKAVGQGHGGGNRCGSPNSAPCSVFSQWWNLEIL